jgi:hypothetical protein
VTRDTDGVAVAGGPAPPLHRRDPSRWFRVECHGIERLPRGAVTLMANHGSQALSSDGAMITRPVPRSLPRSSRWRVIGAEEEEAPFLVRPSRLASARPSRRSGPTLVVPLPSQCRIHFGAPMRFQGSSSPGAVAERVAEVQRALEGLLKEALTGRRHVFF